jgi:hypothetical protein
LNQEDEEMAGIIRRIIRAGGYRIAMKVAKSVPLVGTALAVGLIGFEIKKKGIARGLVNTALDATPVVGLIKNTIEMFTGDWLPDKATGRRGDGATGRQGDRVTRLGDKGTDR